MPSASSPSCAVTTRQAVGRKRRGSDPSGVALDRCGAWTPVSVSNSASADAQVGEEEIQLGFGHGLVLFQEGRVVAARDLH